MRAITGKKYTLEEYFELERNSEEKWEFWDGNVWCMSGASFAHEDIVANMLRSLPGKLPAGCRASGSNVKVKVPSFLPYRYPDLTIVCGKRESELLGGLEVLLNPQVIIEVLSPSTEAFDRGAKFTYYKSIPALREYILIATDRAYITQFVRNAENDWHNYDVEGLNEMLLIRSFDVAISLSEIYLEIEFPSRGFLDHMA
jgi:Uma2 family endonuclease